MNTAEAALRTERFLSVAPREVFAAFEQPDLFAKWWGPSGFTITFDVKPWFTLTVTLAARGDGPHLTWVQGSRAPRLRRRCAPSLIPRTSGTSTGFKRCSLVTTPEPTLAPLSAEQHSP